MIADIKKRAALGLPRVYHYCIEHYSRRSVFLILVLLVVIMAAVMIVFNRANETLSVSFQYNSFDCNNRINHLSIRNNNISKSEASSLRNSSMSSVFHPYEGSPWNSTPSTTVANSSGQMTTQIMTKRPSSCTFCFLHKFNYLIHGKHICNVKNGQQEIDIIILIFTTHARKKQRDALRQTWLSYSKNNTSNVRYAFLLGYTKDSKLQENITKENFVNKDIIQEDFTDSYLNLTYKTMMAMKYVSLYCKNAKFVMKTDDDMYVNVPGLLAAVNRHAVSLQSSVGGHCMTNQRPHRSIYSKWYASYQSYPDRKYPGFCSGTGYITSHLVATKIFEISQHVPFFYLEDVYVGLCLRRLQFGVLAIPGFYLGFADLPICSYRDLRVVTIHEMKMKTLRKIWNSKC